MNINPKSEIGQGVLAYLKENPMSISAFAKASGLSITCIRRVLGLGEERKIDFCTELKLTKFLRDNNQIKGS